MIPDDGGQGQIGGNNNVGGEYNPDELGTVTYPLQTYQTLSIWCPSTTAPIYRTYSDYTKSPWHSGLVGKTGVEVVWKHPVAGAEDQQAYEVESPYCGNVAADHVFWRWSDSYLPEYQGTGFV